MEHGRAAASGQLPWLVSVGLRQNRGPAYTAIHGHRGGGTIIGTRWVLTAAHCLAAVSDLLTPRGRLEPTCDVRLAIASGPDLTAPVREIDVTFAQVHPLFNPRSLEYDAALLRLADDVGGAIDLDEAHVTAGECGIVAGWGDSRAAFGTTPELSWARMHVGSNDMCARQTSGVLIGRPAIMFTAGPDGPPTPGSPRTNLCKGDSGGGFVAIRDAAPRLCGIVSWSASPSPGERTHVLTRTAPLAGWIAREIGER
jgi:secreted trypsin-like serine protease